LTPSVSCADNLARISQVRPNRTPTGAAKALLARLFAFLISCALFIGCENSCFVFQSNPGGTINTNASCQSKTGNISVTFNASVVASQPALRPPRVFVTLRGLDALGEPVPGDEPAWQQLAPQLATKPIQVELTAPRGNSCATAPLASAGVPAGVYRQIRLRFATHAPPDRAAIASLPSEESACGANVFSCLIPPDSSPQPLTWDEPAEIVIPSDRVEGGFIQVLSNSSTHFSIAFDPVSSRALPAGSALRLIPSLSASTESCPTGF
jgi:hypothetical protein